MGSATSLYSLAPMTSTSVAPSTPSSNAFGMSSPCAPGDQGGIEGARSKDLRLQGRELGRDPNRRPQWRWRSTGGARVQAVQTCHTGHQTPILRDVSPARLAGLEPTTLGLEGPSRVRPAVISGSQPCGSV